MNAPYPGTQAVLRAIALLKAFSDVTPELSLTELARLVKLNKATAFRLLTALESEGLVARDDLSDSYRLGPEIAYLGGQVLRSNDMRSASRGELEDLARKTGETATLEVLLSGEVLILDEAAGNHLVGISPWIGSRWPAHATSSGKLLLAHLPEADLRSILEKPLPRFTENTILQPEMLEAELEEIRLQGFAIAHEELEAGYVAVAAPVINFDGQVVAALSLGGPTSRMSESRVEAFAKLLIESTGRVSSWLGHKSASR